MDGFSLTTATTASLSINPSLFSPFSLIRRRRRKPPPSRNINFRPNPKFIVLASNSNDDAAPKLNRWEQMELKFGNMLGEDPKLTLAKIMGKKLNPDASYLDIEKSFHKNKGKIVHIEELPFDGSKKQQSSDSKVQPSNRMNLVRPVPIKSQSSNSLNGLNLVRPIPKKGVRFEANDNSNSLEVKKPNQSVRMKPLENTKGSIPNVILRKPTLYNEDGVDTETSKLRIKSNLSLRMRNEQGKENFSHMTLLRKPEQITATPNPDKNVEASGKAEAEYVDDFELIMRKESQDTPSAITLLKKPEAIGISTNLDEKQETSGYAEEVPLDENKESSLSDIFVSGEEIANATTNSYEKSLESGDGSFSTEAKLQDDSTKGLEPLKQTNMGFTEKGTSVSSDTYMIDSSDNFSIEAALQGKPKRLDQPVKEASNSTRADTELDNLESYGNVDLESFLGTLPLKKPEDTDWTRAEELVTTGERDDVELISCSTRGFVVSFGALIGFLPYRNLAAKWKFLAFESWLRRKGLDPSMYRQSLGIIGSYDGANKNTSHDSIANPEIDRKIGELSQDMKLEELLRIYDKEKIKFLSSFVGQRIKVNVLMADRKSRQLIFSIRPKEKEELVEKKRTLMTLCVIEELRQRVAFHRLNILDNVDKKCDGIIRAKLSIGDVVKCCIRKITYFGIFVEVEGVPALIHQTEVSWDATLDPASYYKIGQIVEAKVHQLDFALERIFLSLKEITPDPLIEALESVVGDRNSLDGKLEAAQPDREWADVESLIKELQQIEGIQSVSKGRYFLSPGLAPTFQVYMASMFENQYKLLARSENKVQEVIVQTSLDKEKMKSAILTCTSRVE